MTKYMALYNVYVDLLHELGELHEPIPPMDPSAMCLQCDEPYPCTEAHVLLEYLMKMDRIHG
jgi:hypothetical protein